MKQTYILVGALITLVLGALLGSFYSSLPVGQVCAYSSENDITGWKYNNGVFEAELSKGWYLLGTAVDVNTIIPQLSSVSSHSISSKDWMIRWNPVENKYELNRNSGDEELDRDIPVTNFPLLSGQGYWYYVKEDGIYTISGTEAALRLPIKRGWNMITAPGFKDVDIGVVKFSYGEETVGLHQAADLRKLFRYVYFYNPEVECASSSYVIIDLKGYGALKPNIGYWIYAYEDGMLEFPESTQQISVEMNIQAERDEYIVGEKVMLKESEVLPSIPTLPSGSTIEQRTLTNQGNIQLQTNVVIPKYTSWKISSTQAQSGATIASITSSPTVSISRSTMESVSRSFLTSNSKVFGVDSSSLRLHSVSQDKTGFTIASYQRTHNTIPIFRSNVIVGGKGSSILYVKSNIGAGTLPSTTPRISSQIAAAAAANLIGAKAAPSSNELIIYPSSNDYVLAYKIIFPFFQKHTWMIITDANTGALLEKQDLLRETNGKVEGKIYPEHTGQPQIDVSFAEEKVKVGESEVFTNTQGEYSTLATGSLLSFLESPWFRVVNEDQASASYTGTSPSWNWGDHDRSDRQEESNVFYHTQKIGSFFKRGGDMNIPWNGLLTLTVEIDEDYCNAYYAGDLATMAFGNSEACGNLALQSDVIYHEYTHGMVDHIYGMGVLPYQDQSGSLNEAVADYFAMTLNNNPCIGEGFMGGECLRNNDNTLRYPENYDTSGADFGGVHLNAPIIAGAMWDLRTKIGAQLTDALIIRTLRLKPFDWTGFLDDMIIADDDNANLEDGTPHISDICSSFVDNHGIVSESCTGRTRDPIARISNDFSMYLKGTVEIQGTAWEGVGKLFDHYSLQLIDADHQYYFLKEGGLNHIKNNILYSFDTKTVKDGEYTIELVVFDKTMDGLGKMSIFKSRIFIANSPNPELIFDTVDGRFSYSGGGIAFEDGVIAAVDEQNHQLFLVSKEGNPLPGWPVSIDFSDGVFGPAIQSSPTFSDLDDDGSKEIVMTSGSHVYVFKLDGTLVPGFPFDTNSFLNRAVGEDEISNMDNINEARIMNHLVLDIENDGNKDIIFFSILDLPFYRLADNTKIRTGVILFILSNDGSVKLQKKFFLIVNSQPTAVDMNNDGIKEIVFSAMNCVEEGNSCGYMYGGSIHVIDLLKGDELDTWPYLLEEGYALIEAPIMADINNDNNVDIVFGAGSLNTKLQTLYALDFNKNLLFRNDFGTFSDPIVMGVSLTDAKNQGNFEILVKNIEKINVFNNQGQEIQSKILSSGSERSQLLSSSRMTDNSNIIFSWNKFWLHSLDGNSLSLLQSMHLQDIDDTIVGSISNDIDNNGILDILASTRKGKIVLWRDNSGISSYKNGDWIEFYHDNRHTNTINTQESTCSPSDGCKLYCSTRDSDCPSCSADNRCGYDCEFDPDCPTCEQDNQCKIGCALPDPDCVTCTNDGVCDTTCTSDPDCASASQGSYIKNTGEAFTAKIVMMAVNEDNGVGELVYESELRTIEKDEVIDLAELWTGYTTVVAGEFRVLAGLVDEDEQVLSNADGKELVSFDEISVIEAMTDDIVMNLKTTKDSYTIGELISLSPLAFSPSSEVCEGAIVDVIKIDEGFSQFSDLQQLTTTLSDQSTTTSTNLLQQRKDSLLELIKNNPEEAIRTSPLPTSVVQALSSTLAESLVERRGEYIGYFEAVHYDNFTHPDQSKFVYQLHEGNKKFIIHASSLPTISPGTKFQVKGISIGDDMATDFAGGFTILEEPSDIRPENMGDQKVLVILANVGLLNAPVTADEARSLIFSDNIGTVQNFYKENSYNKVLLSGDIVGPYDLPQSVCSGDGIERAALLASLPNLESMGKSIQDYSRIIYAIPDACNSGYRGYATIGKTIIDLPDGSQHRVSESTDFEFGLYVVSHELGHNFGVRHANNYRCVDSEGRAIPFSYECENDEYGDRMSVMGSMTGHHTAPHKAIIGWLSEENIHTTTEGTVFLYPLEVQKPAGSVQMIKIPMDIETTFRDISHLFYTVELRQSIGYDSLLDDSSFNGISIRIARIEPGKPDFQGSELLLFDDLPRFSIHDVILLPGESFTDLINGVKITLQSLVGSGVNAVAEVKVEHLEGTEIDFTTALAYFKFDNVYVNDREDILDASIITPSDGSIVLAARLKDDVFSRSGGLYFYNGELDIPRISSIYWKKNNAFTLSLWFMQKRNQFSSLFGSNSMLRIEDNIPKVILTSSNLGQYQTDEVVGFPLTLNEWHHIAVVFNQGTLLLYQDGDEVGRITLGPYDALQFEHEKITANNHQIIDEVMSYARAISASEVRSIYESHVPIQDEELQCATGSFILNDGKSQATLHTGVVDSSTKRTDIFMSSITSLRNYFPTQNILNSGEFNAFAQLEDEEGNIINGPNGNELRVTDKFQVIENSK